MKTNANHIGRKWLTGAIALALALAPSASRRSPRPRRSPNLPIASKVTAKPNIMYTLDDSGSMAYNYIPDYTILNYCRNKRHRRPRGMRGHGQLQLPAVPRRRLQPHVLQPQHHLYGAQEVRRHVVSRPERSEHDKLDARAERSVSRARGPDQGRAHHRRGGQASFRCRSTATPTGRWSARAMSSATSATRTARTTPRSTIRSVP